MTVAADLVLALGGGTARAMSHVGALLALEEAGTEPAGLAGTSFGAIVAGLWAMGTPPATMKELLTAPTARQVWAQALDPGLHRGSLVHGRRLEAWLDSLLFHGARIEDLERPLAVATTSLHDGGLVVVREGSLARAVVASCSLPLLFAPVQYGADWLVDGGFVEAVPFRAALSLGRAQLLGINTGIDIEKAALAAGLRRLRQRNWSRRVSDWGVSRLLNRPHGRVLRGLGWAARSYARPQTVPAGALLLRIDPAVAWWDFHRTQAAVQSGLAATRAALEAGLLDRLGNVEGSGPEVTEDDTGTVAAVRSGTPEPLVDGTAETRTQSDR